MAQGMLEPMLEFRWLDSRYWVSTYVNGKPIAYVHEGFLDFQQRFRDPSDPNREIWYTIPLVRAPGCNTPLLQNIFSNKVDV